MLSIAFFNTTQAAFNEEINYQGKLLDNTGAPVADGSYNVNFALYTALSGGTQVWSSTTTVSVVSGLFSHMLGSDTVLTGVDFDQTLYLAVKVGGTGAPVWDAEMSPRKILGAVPAAFEAQNAQTLDSIATSSFLRSDQADTISATEASTLLTITQNGVGDILNLFDGASEVFTVIDGGNIGIGTTSPSRLLSVAGDAVITGALYDSSNSAGTNGYVLQTTGAGTQWVATSSLGFGVGDGTVTSVDMSVPTGLSVSGGPITTSGTFALTYDTGYAAVLTASTTNWNTFYNTPSTRITAGTGISWSGNSLNLDNDFGATIDSLEITDGTIAEEDLNLNTAVNAYILAASSTAPGGMAWYATSSPYLNLSSGGGGAAAFLDLSDVELTSLTANRIIFASSTGSALTDSASFLYAASSQTLTVGGMTIADGLTTHTSVSTTTVPNNEPYAWTIATSTDGVPFFRVDTTGNATAVSLGAAGDVYIGDVGSPSNLVFEESATISGQGTNTITLGVAGDTFTVAPGVAFTVGTTTQNGLLTVASSTSQTLVTAQQYGTGDLLNLLNGTSEVFTVLNNGNIGIGTTSPSRLLSVAGDAVITGALYDSSNSAGANGYVLQTTGAGTQWVATSSLGFGSGDGSVTSVALSAPTGFTVSGSPVTTSGTLTFAYDTGYEGLLTASSTNWNTFYNTPSTRITAGDGIEWSTNTLNVNDVTATMLANADFGDFSCDGTVCSFDASTAGSSTLNAANWTDAYVLQASSTAAGGFAWVATSSLGFAGGSTVTFGTDNQIPYVNAGGTDFDYSGTFTFDGINFTTGTTTLAGSLTVNGGATSTFAGNVNFLSKNIFFSTTTEIELVTNDTTSSVFNFTSNTVNNSGTHALTLKSADGSILGSFAGINSRTYVRGYNDQTFVLYDTGGNLKTSLIANGQSIVIRGEGLAGAMDDTPDARLEVSGNGSTAFDIFYLSSNDDTDGDYVTVTGTGDFGIGTTNPGAKLDVAGTASSSDLLVANTVTLQAITGGILASNVSGTVSASTSLSASFIEDAYVRNTGDTMTGPLTITGAGELLRLEDGDGEITLAGANTSNTNPIFSLIWENDDSGVVYDAASIVSYNGGAVEDGDLRFSTAQAGILLERMRITDDGDVGIGTTTPNQKLTVAGAINIDTPEIELYGLNSRFLYASNTIRSVILGGGDAGSQLTGTGYWNTGVGYGALASTTVGDYNTAIGHASLYNNTTGNGNTALGEDTLFTNTTGYYNTAIGADTMFSNTDGYYNVALGTSALYSNTSGNNNVALGTAALYDASTTTNLIGIGSYALSSQVSGNGLIAIGGYALQTSTSSIENIAIGDLVMQYNTTGQENTIVGYRSGRDNTTGSENAVLGARSFERNTTGGRNVVMGVNALNYNISGDENNAFGYAALNQNVSGSNNSAFGSWALRFNATGTYNVAMGRNALTDNTGGGYNVAVGSDALANNTTGDYNTGIGRYAGWDITTGSHNTLLGQNTGRGIVTGSNNTIVGANVTGLDAALANHVIIADGSGNQRIVVDAAGDVGIGTTTPGYSLTVVGDTHVTGALYDSTQSAGTNGHLLLTTGAGTQWVATSSLGFSGMTLTLGTGDQIPFMNAGGTDFEYSSGFTYNDVELSVDGSVNVANTSLGYEIGGTRMFYASTTNQSVAIGDGAGAALLTNGSYNVFVGRRAGFTATSSDYNTFVGWNSGLSNTSGSDNTAIGARSLENTTTGLRLVAVGSYALNNNTTGVDNTAVGRSALNTNTTGNWNTALGTWTLRFNATGTYNTALGRNALTDNTGGSYNVAVGTDALNNNGVGNYNSSLGHFSGYDLTTGSNNLFLGRNAGRGITTGSNNTIIGANVTGLDAALANHVIIADGSGNHRIVVDSTGDVGIGTSTPVQALQVYGDVRVGGGTNGCIEDYEGDVISGTCTSDERLKTDIEALSSDPAHFMEQFALLEPVSYRWNEVARDAYARSTQHKTTGLIAQNVEEAFPELVSENADGFKQVDFSALSYYVIQAVKEIWQMVDGFATRFTTNELCVGEVCVTEEEFRSMVESAGESGAVSSSGSGNTSEGTTEPEPQPASETVSEPEDTASSTPATTATSTPETTSETAPEEVTSAEEPTSEEGATEASAASATETETGSSAETTEEETVVEEEVVPEESEPTPDPEPESEPATESETVPAA